MKDYKKKFLGTVLEIRIFDKNVNDSHLEAIFQIIENFENKYSRFQTGNYLWMLNQEKEAPIDDDFQTILHIANKVHKLSKGHFDLTVLPFLENIGYGIAKENLEENFGMQNILVENGKIFLKNNVQIEIGGIGKGYMVDVIFDNLSQNYNHFIVNFGGDIRIAGKQEFLLEDPIDDTKFVGKIEIENLALASSGSSKRKTQKGHHLINPKTGTSDDEKLGVYVTHRFASFADTFATALFVSPIYISLEILQKVDGLEAMIIMKNGEIYKTRNFNIKK